MSEVQTAVMGALDLALDVAFHDATPRDLAVAAEAYTVAGYHDGAINISHSGGWDSTLAAVAAARKGRHKEKLRREAVGMVRGLTVLAKCGLISYSSCAEANRQRWLARGGHGFTAAVYGLTAPLDAAISPSLLSKRDCRQGETL